MNLWAIVDNKSLSNFSHFSVIVDLKLDIEFPKMNKVSSIHNVKGQWILKCPFGVFKSPKKYGHFILIEDFILNLLHYSFGLTSF